MRQITANSINAFLAGQLFSAGNMSTDRATLIDGAVSSLYLHGNLIAEKRGSGGDYDVTLRDAGWQSTTTKERLNGLLNTLGLPSLIGQRDYAWYINGEDWLGSVVVVVRDGTVQRIESTRANGDVINVPLRWLS